VIATPSRALQFLQSKVCQLIALAFTSRTDLPRKSLSLTSLESLVIDEADLILSYGHDEDIRQIPRGSFLPKVFQSFLMSATMTEDVEMLKGLVLRNPVSLVPSHDQRVFIDK
jgi:ATP-dependent RNA helicase DDX56/DBP9